MVLSASAGIGEPAAYFWLNCRPWSWVSHSALVS